MPHAPKSQAIHVVVHGRVQGVGYRYFAHDAALRLGLSGWVRNQPDRSVEAYAEGPKEALERFLEVLGQGPSASRVERLETSWPPAQGKDVSFEIK